MRMLILAALLAMPSLAWADLPATPFALCRTASAAAERLTGVPDRLMQTIGTVESRRREPGGAVSAWPWTINAEGVGSFFNTKAEAIAAVTALRARGVQSIDVGCMQVNLMYHPAAFASLEEAFDPAANVRYAAKFLGQLFAETGDWNTAAAHYHSKTPDLALAYQRKVLAQLPGAARVQAVSAEQLSLTNAWSSTLGTAPASAPRQTTGTGARRHGRRIRARSCWPAVGDFYGGGPGLAAMAP